MIWNVKSLYLVPHQMNEKRLIYSDRYTEQDDCMAQGEDIVQKADKEVEVDDDISFEVVDKIVAVVVVLVLHEQIGSYCLLHLCLYLN